MKRFINIALCLSVIAGAIPMGANAKSQPITLENGTDHWEMTSISGDVNSDGKVSVADALLLQKCFANKYDYIENERFDESKLDVNFDGYFDSFDLVQIRKLVINPEKAEKQTFAVDIINTDAEISVFEEKYIAWNEGENFSSIITSYDEMSTYLETFITDSDELNKYLDKYNETFFEENNLILEPFIQERGNGIFQQIVSNMKLTDCNFNDKSINNVVCFAISGIYNNDTGLYPITNTKMLAQVAIPKSQTNADTGYGYIHVDSIFSEYGETVSYTDEEHEIVITQESGWGNNSNVYIKDGDSFIYVASMYPNFYFQNSELSADDYIITFNDESFIIDYRTRGTEWTKEEYSYSGDFINIEYYEK